MANESLFPKFPQSRPRRLRQKEGLRRLMAETKLSLNQLVMPYFVQEGNRVKEPIEAMPGQFRFSVDTLLEELGELQAAGIRSILLFGIPDQKDEKGGQAWSAQGIVQKAVCEIKKQFEDLTVITDVCLCAYTSHGHCGIVNAKGEIENDASLKFLNDVALSHAEAGSDLIAPSDMMDGRIQSIRHILDQKGFQNLPIMSYAAKFASAYYGPFRDAAHSAPAFGDRRTYQMDNGNRDEALREIAMDIQEGADIVMVKPALAYLDIIREAAQRYRFPLAAYSVSGEYSMIKAAAEKGYLDEKQLVLENMLSLTRAGAQVLITYHAKEIGIWRENLNELQAIYFQ